jgi:hyperosmotically inducible protein
MSTLNVRANAALSCLLLAVPAFADKTAGETIDDATIATSTKTALIENDKVSAGSINVEVNKGTVQLAGFLDSEAEKSAALATAGRVKGVAKVLDGLVVIPGHRSMGEAVDDTTIQAKLKAELTSVEGMDKALSINTGVRQGHVLLSGFVHGDKAKAQAGEIAKGISGVKQVHNNIAVTH